MLLFHQFNQSPYIGMTSYALQILQFTISAGFTLLVLQYIFKKKFRYQPNPLMIEIEVSPDFDFQDFSRQFDTAELKHMIAEHNFFVIFNIIKKGKLSLFKSIIEEFPELAPQIAHYDSLLFVKHAVSCNHPEFFKTLISYVRGMTYTEYRNHFHEMMALAEKHKDLKMCVAILKETKRRYPSRVIPVEHIILDKRFDLLEGVLHDLSQLAPNEDFAIAHYNQLLETAIVNKSTDICTYIFDWMSEDYQQNVLIHNECRLLKGLLSLYSLDRNVYQHMLEELVSYASEDTEEELCKNILVDLFETAEKVGSTPLKEFAIWMSSSHLENLSQQILIDIEKYLPAERRILSLPKAVIFDQNHAAEADAKEQALKKKLG